jgi:hypothetical protein
MNKSKRSKIIEKGSLTASMSVVSCLALGVYFGISSAQTNIGDCIPSTPNVSTNVNTLPATIQCPIKGNEVSWLAWFTNKSTSNQFHFLDLLELLSQFNSENNE